MKIKSIYCNFLKIAFFLFTLILRSTMRTHSTLTHTASTRATWIPDTCPNACNCSLTFSWILSRSLRTVDCRDLDLDLPPMNISGEAEAIVLSGNRLLTGSLALLRDLVLLTQLEMVGCHVHSLEDLVLGGHGWTLGSRVLNADRNLLTQLHDGSFINLAELELLILSNNRIETIHSNAFAGLTRLTSLDLSGNRLTTLADARWLCHVRRVTTIDLSANGIHVIPRFAFRCLSLLRTLDVSRNRIRHVDDEAFFGLRQLRHLSLDDNVLPVIPSDAISQLTGVTHLSLSGNAFAEVASDSFRSTAKMTSLRLNRMWELRLVDRWAFRNMTSLERLEMSDNRRLKFIHHEAFQGLRSLRELDLNGSAVESIDQGLVEGGGAPSLSVIGLRSAPLVCDCVLAWFVRRLTTNETGNGSKSGFLSGTEARCQSPAELKGIRVAEVGLDQVSVPCGPRILPLFSKEVNVRMTDPVRLHCHAVGVPRPRSFWISRSNFSLSLSSTSSTTNQLNRSEEEILQVDSASTEDQGVYTCSAVSPSGRHQRQQVFLRVQPLNVSVLVIRVTLSSITVTWRVTDHTRDYSLAFRRRPTENYSTSAVQTVPIKHYMRSFTASELPPETEFEFCVGIRLPPTNHFRSVNCTTASTRNRKYDESRQRSRDPYAAGVVVVVAAAVAVCCAVVCFGSSVVCSAVKTLDRTKRHLQEEEEAPSADRMFLSSLEGGGGDGNNMAPETYENEAVESAIFDDADLDEIRNTAYMNIVRSP